MLRPSPKCLGRLTRSRCWFALPGLLAVAGLLPNSALAQQRFAAPYCGPNCVPCQPGTMPYSTAPAPKPSDAKPGETPTPPTDQQPAQNPMTSPDNVFNNPAPSAPATTAMNSNSAPGSIGDFFGVAFVPTRYTSGLSGSIGHSSTGGLNVPGPYTPLGGRQKLVEHDSPLPRDRAFINYSFFDDVPLSPVGTNVNRVTFGAEQTLWDGMASLQVRIPTLNTLDSDILADRNDLGGTNYELGNINFTGKLLLCQNDCSALSIGVAVTVPTADDIRVFTRRTPASPYNEVLRYENEAVHVLPFIGGIYTPNRNYFSQWIVQLDIDTNGNPVLVKSDTSPRMLQVARLQDADFVYATLTQGVWLTREDSRCGLEKGCAAIAELNYNASISDPDTVSGRFSNGNVFGIGTPAPGDAVGDTIGRFSALNLTLGVHSQFSRNCNVTVGYCVPIAGLSREDQFNGEVRVLFNYMMGRGGGFYNR